MSIFLGGWDGEIDVSCVFDTSFHARANMVKLLESVVDSLAEGLNVGHHGLEPSQKGAALLACVSGYRSCHVKGYDLISPPHHIELKRIHERWLKPHRWRALPLVPHKGFAQPHSVTSFWRRRHKPFQSDKLGWSCQSCPILSCPVLTLSWLDLSIPRHFIND